MSQNAFASRFKSTVALLFAWISAIIGFCAVGVWVIRGLLGFGFGPRVEMRPRKYARLLSDWRVTGLISHFPKTIPRAAMNVRLSAFPGFMRGGAWFQIRMTLPPADVAARFAEATARAKAFYDGGDKYTLVNSTEGGLAGTSFHTAGPKDYFFPDDYRIFIYEARAHGGPDPRCSPWWSGTSIGMVISQEKNEVIYFAENW